MNWLLLETFLKDIYMSSSQDKKGHFCPGLKQESKGPIFFVNYVHFRVKNHSNFSDYKSL